MGRERDLDSEERWAEVEHLSQRYAWSCPAVWDDSPAGRTGFTWGSHSQMLRGSSLLPCSPTQ